MPPQGARFLSRFGLKTGIDFGHFGMESGIFFKGTTGIYEIFIVLTLNEEERKRNMQIQRGFQETFSLAVQVEVLMTEFLRDEV